MPHARLIAWILLLVFTSTLIACGSGSSDKDPQPEPDPQPDPQPEPDPQPDPQPEPSTKPDTFSFMDVEDAEPEEDITSDTVTITGIDTDVPVEIDKGRYAINDGAFTNNAGTLSPGDRLTLKLKADSELDTLRTATVTVGNGSATFTVITIQDTQAPEAAFLFPPPMSATDQGELTLRGTAQDDYSDIDEFTLTAYIDGEPINIDVNTDNQYATWQATLILSSGEEYTLVVATEDSLGNKETEAASVTVRHKPFEAAFPDDKNVFTRASGVTFDGKRNRVLISDIEQKAIVAIDIKTGGRTILSAHDWDDEDQSVGLDNPRDLVVDSVRDQVLVVSDQADPAVVSVDVETGVRDIFYSETLPGGDMPEFKYPFAIAVDPDDKRSSFVTSRYHVAKLDLKTKTRTLLSGQDDDIPLVNPYGLLVDSPNNRLLVTDGSLQAVVAIDMESGERSIFADPEKPKDGVGFICPFGIVSDKPKSRVLVGDCGLGVVSMDLETGRREVLMDPGIANPGGNVLYLYTEKDWPYVFVVDRYTQGLYALDLESREYVTISQSEMDPSDL